MTNREGRYKPLPDPVKRYRTYSIDHAFSVKDIVLLSNFELLKSKEVYDVKTKKKVSIALKNSYDTEMNLLTKAKWKSKKQLASNILTYLFECILDDLLYNNAIFIFPMFSGTIKFNTLPLNQLKFKMRRGIYQDVDLFKTDKSAYHLELKYMKKGYSKTKRINIDKTTYKNEVLYKANEGEVFVSYMEYRYGNYVRKIADKFNQVDRLRIHYFVKNILCSVITQIYRGHDVLIQNKVSSFYMFTRIPAIGLQKYKSRIKKQEKEEILNDLDRYKVYLNQRDLKYLNKLEQRYEKTNK